MLLVLVLGVGASFAADSNQTGMQASDDTDTVVSITETDTVSIDENTTIINVDSDSSEKLRATGDRDELQTLITNNYGKEISLDKDYLFTSGTNHAGITISSAITINGNGHIIDAAQTGRIFQITAQNVILKNITFKNGKINNHGGLILWNARYGTIDHCDLYNGDTSLRGGRGGAIYFQQGYGNISYCNFEKSKASVDGRGGALYIASGHMDIDHSTFKENLALAGDGDSGAIWFEGGYSNITNNYFDSNACIDASFDIYMSGGTSYYVYGNTFKNGYGRGSGDADGSSVGLASVTYSTFDHNWWINGHAYSGVCGGLYVRGSCSNIYITNNEFHNNTARNWGGAISVFPSSTVVNIVIRNNTFVNNTASYGGAIALPTTASTMTIEDCKFINNTATAQSGYSSTLTGSGGAIYANCYTTLVNCEFSGNDATTGSGGAIYTTHTCTIKNTNFTDNVAAVNGGAIYDGTTDTSLTFAIGNVSFVNNKATENGGALYIADGATVTLDNYYCSGNTAATNPDIKTDGITILVMSMYVKVGQNGDGLSTNTPTNWTYALANVPNEGTIYLMGGSEYTLTGLVISGKTITVQGYDNNVVFNANRAGPVFTVSVQGVTIRNIHFKNAYRAGNGAAILWSGYYGLLKDCTFENCESYTTSNNGAVYWTGNGGTVDNCTFINNKATGTSNPDAGAICWAATEGVIKNSYFKNNTGLNDGGAIIVSGSTITNLEIYNCNFVENKAQTTNGRGGAISVWDGDNVKIYNCNFTKNTAESGLGGAIYWHSGSPNGNIYDCNFDQNTAVNGGAVYWNGAAGSLSSSNFTSNVATEKGGAVYWNTNDGTITSSNFNSNRAVNGSAIYLSPSVTEFELKDDKFTSNVASGYGTVAAEQLTDLSVGGNTFTSNTVGSGATDYYFYDHTPETITSALVYVSPSGSASNLGMTSDSPTTFDHALEIIEEGGKIVLLNGEYSNIVEKTISQSIAIVGSGNTVLLGGNKKFFTITANGVTIQDITFKNGKVTGNGGAITWSGANGQIIGSTFTNNVATGNGGALYWTGTGGKIDSSTFESNSAASGNNLYSTNTVTVTNSVLKDHFTLTKTGTINYGADEVISGTFASNAPSSVTLYLGTTSYGSISLGSNTFSKTLSLLPVGTHTISFKDVNSNTYTFTDNSFTVNRLSTVYISPSGTGIGNSASSPTTWDKVADIITSTGTVVFVDGTYSDFYGKTISQGWTLQAASGATPVLDANSKGRFFTISGNNVTIKNINFKNGHVDNNNFGGAIYWTGSYGSLINCNFENNSAHYGGAISWSGAYGNVTSCNFNNNYLNYAPNTNPRGGAIYWNGRYGYITQSTFTNNRATAGDGDAGAICLDGGYYMTITHTKFDKNYCIDAGSCIWGETGSVQLLYCNFTNSVGKGSDDGGAVAITGTNHTIAHCIFENCSGNSRGGGIQIYGGSMNIYDCNFTNCSSKYGGAIYSNGNTASNVTDCEFVNNHATSGNGGAVVLGSGSKIESCSFENNTATGTGGAIYIHNGNAETKIIDSTFEGNNAPSESDIASVGKTETSALTFNTDLTINVNDVIFGESLTVTGTLSAAKAGAIIDIKDKGTKIGTVTVNNNQFTYTLTAPSLGTHTISLATTDNSGNTYVYNTNSFSFRTVPVDSYSALQILINRATAASTLTLARTYSYNSAYDTALVGGVKVNKSLTIKGAGYSIDGKNAARAFEVSANSVTIENTKLVNGKSTANGGAIYWTGTGGKIDSSTFEFNSAASGNNLYSTNAVTVTNSVLKDHFTLTKTGNINYGTDEVIGGTFASNVPSSVTLFLGTTSYGDISVGSNKFSKTLSLLPVGTHTISFKDANSNTYTFTDNSFTVNSLSTVYISPSGTGSGNSVSSPTTWDKVADILTSSGTVVFTDGIYTDFYDKTISSSWTLKPDSNANVVLDGGNKGRIFTISANNVRIEGMTLQNGKASSGSGNVISNTGSGLTIDNVEFINNVANQLLIYSPTKTITLTNSHLDKPFALTTNDISYGSTETITGTFLNSNPTTTTIYLNGVSKGTFDVGATSHQFTAPISGLGVGSYVVTDLKNISKEVF